MKIKLHIMATEAGQITRDQIVSIEDFTNIVVTGNNFSLVVKKLIEE